MSKQRYNEQQIGAILQRSGEIQAGLSPDADSQGLTLEELQKVASEVGIEPHVVEQAALEVDGSAFGAKKGESAGPRVLDHTVDGAITEEQWEDMVISLRQYSGKAGTSTLQGTTREWTGEWDLGSLTLTASTRNNRTRFRLLGDSTGASALGWILGPTFGLIGTLILCAMLRKFGVDVLPVILVAMLAVGLVFGLTVMLTRSWQKKSQHAFGQMFANIIAIAGSTPPLPASTSASVVEDEVVQQNEA